VKNLGLTSAQTSAYLARLFGSHDYRIEVELLTLNETPAGSLVLLDGQINLQSGEQVRRTASVTVSDPAGMLDTTGVTTLDDEAIGPNRLIRLTHRLHVPATRVGNTDVAAFTVSVPCFIGPPATMSRTGAEVSIELQEKTALALRGTSAYTAAKGTNARSAIRDILAKKTGEFRFNLGSGTRRLSRAYAVGLTDDASPWLVASQIASSELGMQLIYSCDGYATLRPRPGTSALTIPYLTDVAATSTDFTAVSNFVQVTGKKTTTTTKTAAGSTVTTTTQPQATAQITSGPLSPAALARKGISRLLPKVITDDAYTTTAQAKWKADLELAGSDQLEAAPTFACVPVFHLDSDDIVTVLGADGSMAVRLERASIPLGTSGDMSIGTHRWVSVAPTRRTTVTANRRRTVTRRR
jgi:hypothetical protein